jgi:hypothetical protein
MADRFDPAVNALLDTTMHPLRKEIDTLCAIILSADMSIVEGVKWNAVSFRTSDWFATLNGPKHVKGPMVILHAGAKAEGVVLDHRIPDPQGLITWLGNDRGQIIFQDAADIDTKQKALQAIVSAWIKLT